MSFGGCDGLMAGGRNENQGAESTLALLGDLAAGTPHRGAHAAPLTGIAAGQAGPGD